MSENDKINFNTANIMEFLKRDLFSRTLYNTDAIFLRLFDTVITNIPAGVVRTLTKCFVLLGL